jgi:hypothetical protein
MNDKLDDHDWYWLNNANESNKFESHRWYKEKPSLFISVVLYINILVEHLKDAIIGAYVLSFILYIFYI